MDRDQRKMKEFWGDEKGQDLRAPPNGHQDHEYPTHQLNLNENLSNDKITDDNGKYPRGLPPSKEEQTRVFGCPFYKREPIRHRDCLFRYLYSTKTNYVKQHLRRHHLQPLHCPVCGDQFESPVRRDSHIRTALCSPRQFTSEGINLSQEEAIERIPRNDAPEERWFKIWDIIFPDAPRPQSPYVEDPWVEVVEQSLSHLMKPLSGGNTATHGDGGITSIPYDIQKKVIEQIRREASNSIKALTPPSPESNDLTEAVRRNADATFFRSPTLDYRLLSSTYYDSGIQSTQAILPPHPVEPECASTSEQAGGSRHDSGYGSHVSACKPLQDTGDAGDTESIYSVDTVSPEVRNRYIAIFSSRLTQDICKLPGFSEIFKGTRAQLEAWVKTFSLKLQQESSAMNGRDASQFIRRYRKDIVHELDGLVLGDTFASEEEEESTELRTPFRMSENDIHKWAGAIEASEQDLETSSLASEVELELDLPNLEEYEQLIPESQAYKWLLSRIDSHAQLNAQGENCLTEIGDYIRAQVMLQKPFRLVSRQAGPLVVQMIFHLDWDIEAFGQNQEFTLPLSQVLDHVICLTGTWSQAQAMTVAEYMTQTWPSTNEPIRALIKMRLDDLDVKTVECELADGQSPIFC